MARVPELQQFCRLHGLKIITIADLAAYRLEHSMPILATEFVNASAPGAFPRSGKVDLK